MPFTLNLSTYILSHAHTRLVDPTITRTNYFYILPQDLFFKREFILFNKINAKTETQAETLKTDKTN